MQLPPGYPFDPLTRAVVTGWCLLLASGFVLCVVMLFSG